MSRGKPGRRGGAHTDKTRDFPIREDGQLYARVTKMLGNGRLLATGSDGVERMCKIRGSMRKREWVRVGDTVLVALRHYQDEKADVVFRYNDAEVHRLRHLGEDVGVPCVDDGEDDTHDLVQFEPGDDADELVWESI